MSDKKDVRCRKCGHVVGKSDGQFFWAGGCKFYRVVSYYCIECGHKNIWRPYPKEKTVVK